MPTAHSRPTLTPLKAASKPREWIAPVEYLEGERHSEIRHEYAYYYPDVMVACDPADDNRYYREHPAVIVEVLSFARIYERTAVAAVRPS